jgi:hypothetical protein
MRNSEKKLAHKLTKLEKKFSSLSEGASLARARLLREAEATTRKLEALKAQRRPLV